MHQELPGAFTVYKPFLNFSDDPVLGSIYSIRYLTPDYQDPLA